jgi:hypothetical protein
MSVRVTLSRRIVRLRSMFPSMLQYGEPYQSLEAIGHAEHSPFCEDTLPRLA